ncbi:MAG TPA: SBBP repeat-containing protein [Terriglobia bacterium]|nr:SBBP repeat-containing protein [Terriglobia bacterium]
MKNTNRNRSRLVIVCLIPLLLLTIPGRRGHGDRLMLAAGAAANPSKPDIVVQQRILQSYGKLPLAFETNQGQADARVKFLARGAGYTLFLTGDEAVLELQGSGARGQGRVLRKSEGRRQKAEGKSETRNSKLGTFPSQMPSPESRTTAVVTMQLAGANPSAPSKGIDQLLGKSNYFIGNDPKKWRTNVPTYAKVRYQGVYPGVDLVYYGNQGQLEYDFVVGPGANASAIQLDFGVRQHAAAFSLRSLLRHQGMRRRGNRKGGGTQATAEQASLRKSGSELPHSKALRATSRNSAPASKGGGTQATAEQASLRKSGSKLPHSKALRAISRNSAPASSRHGAARARPGRSEGMAALRLDRNGDLVVKISGREVRFHKPMVYQPSRTPNAESRTPIACRYRVAGHRVTFEIGTYDRTKPLVIDPALSYSTFLGGSAFDEGFGIAVDSSGNAYVTGETLSTNFPTTAGAFQTSCDHGCSTGSDAFITKLNPSGTALVYSTYLGGSSTDYGQSIALDGSGDAFVTGTTTSVDFPNTAGAFQNLYGGGDDAFVTELNPSGSALVYSTYLGGSGSDQGFGIAVDKTGNAYVTGMTASTNFPVTPGSAQETFGGTSDAFVTKLNASGSALVYSTYLGGSNSDSGNAIALDAFGFAYLTGSTQSTNFPITLGAFQIKCAVGCADAFVTKLNPTGSKLAYSTYLGGGGVDVGLAIAIDASRNVYVDGSTSSRHFPTTPGAFQTKYSGGNSNGFLSKLNSTGTALVYSTFFGDAPCRGIAVDPPGNAYLTGSGVGITTTPGALQTFCQTGRGCAGDAYMSELNPSGSALIYSTYIGFGGFGNGITLDASNNVYLTGEQIGKYFPTTPGAFQTTLGGVADAFVAKFVPSPNVGLSISSLDFGTVTIGTSSAGGRTKLTNTGNTTLNITLITLGGADKEDFSQSSNCGTQLVVGATCTLDVKFIPTAVGTRNAQLLVIDDAPDSPQRVSLTGTGTASGGSLSPTTLTFPATVVFTNSAPLTATLTSTGTAALSISSIFVGNGSGFSETNNCGSSLAPGASCAINVTFTPTVSGLNKEILFVEDNGPGGFQETNLQGLGTDIQLAPTSVAFGKQKVGTSSKAMNVMVTNKSAATVTITGISIMGQDPNDFSETTTCGSTLSPGEICSVSVTFTPTATGLRSATVSVSDNGGGSPQTVKLSGTGT